MRVTISESFGVMRSSSKAMIRATLYSNFGIMAVHNVVKAPSRLDLALGPVGITIDPSALSLYVNGVTLMSIDIDTLRAEPVRVIDTDMGRLKALIAGDDDWVFMFDAKRGPDFTAVIEINAD